MERVLLGVCKGVSVMTAQLAYCILEGLKRWENRVFKMATGWYYLQVSDSIPKKQPRKHTQAHNRWLTHAHHITNMSEISSKLGFRIPEESSLEHYLGNIVGLFHVKESRSVDKCGNSVWATGPVCNLIDRTIKLIEPIKQRGWPGVWVVKDGTQKRISNKIRKDISKLKLKINNV